VTIFSVFASFEKFQIRFPLKNHEIAMGTCFDVLFLTTECNENLFFKELHKMSKQAFIAFKINENLN